MRSRCARFDVVSVVRIWCAYACAPYRGGRRAQMHLTFRTPGRRRLRPVCARVGAQMRDGGVVGEVEACCLPLGAVVERDLSAVLFDHVDDAAGGEQAVPHVAAALAVRTRRGLLDFGPAGAWVLADRPKD